ncbi:MAG: putative replicative helicase, dnaB, partial [Nitrospirae bacterium]|nr:putative replicative helicase, dnaB [Nitrospirota bacterium]
MRRAEPQTERVLPQNAVAEISVLGAILQNAQAVAEAIEVLQPEDFFTSVHQNVFAACQHLFNANGAVDIVTVGQEMMRRGTLERATYLMELVDAVPTAANVRHHAAIVKEKATMRRIIESGRAIVARAYEDQDAASAVLDWAEQQLFNVSQGRAKASFIEVKTLLRPVFEQMEAVYERKEAVTGIATSFARLDEMTTGFQASDLVVLAARPSMGKTSFALNLADHVATTTQTPVAVFSLEMTKEQLVQRLLCARARVESRKIRTGYIRDVDWPRLTAAAGVLSGAPIYIDDSSAQSVLEMRAKARRLKTEKGLGLVIIDYLQLITGMRRHEGRVQEVSEISRSLKMMAKDL